MNLKLHYIYKYPNVFSELILTNSQNLTTSCKPDFQDGE